MSHLIMYDAATVFAQLLRGAPDGLDYRISRMYVEFENNAGAAVTPPTLSDRAEGISYYAGLSVHATRDYLRATVSHTTLDSAGEDYPSGNILTVDAHVSAGTGVHGKPFAAAQQSRVYGGALVATPDPDDPSQDLIVSRFYYASSGLQLILPASTGLVIEQVLTLA